MSRTIAVADSYTAEEFARLVSRETDRLELKTGTGAKPLQEAMVAFSNTDGGVIFIGVDDQRRVHGRGLDQGTDDRIHAAAVGAHSMGRYRIREIKVDGRPVVAVQVWRREDGVAQTSDGRILARRGARNQAVIGEDVWHLMSSRTLRRFERAGSGVPRGRIDSDDLRLLCAAYGWSATESNLDDRLRERGLLTDDELTIAGALVLTDPSRTLGTRKFVIEIRLYEDPGTAYRRRVVIGGSLPGQVEEAAGFVTAELGSDLVVVGVLRHDLPRLPAPVIREAIANAASHRSYELDQSAVIVEIRPRQVTVTSPGRLPDSVTVETMRQAQAARNPVVIDVLRRFGLTEDAGRGVDVMQDLMREEMLDPPVFEEVGEFLRVTLPINGPVTPQERAWLKDLEAEGALEPPDRLLLAHAARGEALTNSRAREITRLDRVEARAALHRLRDTGLLVQQGRRGGTNYVLARGIGHGAVRRLSEQEIERMVLDEAAQRPIRNEDVRRLTGLDRAEVSALLGRLTARGQLVRRGERRGTEYVVGGEGEGVRG